MTTQFPEDPLTYIIEWQTKFKENKMETSNHTKDSREFLHNTSNATDSIKDWRNFWKDVLDEQEVHVYSEHELTEAINQQKTITKQKAVDNFLDEICCALEELSGEEVFECFLEAVQAQHEYTKKEHKKTSELLDLLTGLKL